MKGTIEVGASFSRDILVDRGRTIGHLGEDLRVYATPEFVRDIEETCLKWMQPYCEDDEGTVGTGIELAHSGATPLGGTVTIDVTVSAVDGRRVSVDFVARDDLEEVGRGSHSRFIVRTDRLKQGIAAKIAKLKGA